MEHKQECTYTSFYVVKCIPTLNNYIYFDFIIFFKVLVNNRN